ncbi:transcription factor ETV7-like isoform X2 [Hyla sarda]|uniref:transcription factor ETV7-like isoform X2 n=1 Tax=Hyla sarda TaxID=327740 RepID=UPI0024C3BB5E|nr:transcription factor ETV7-like isoform X2 [Hyla sarda]
MSKLDTYQTTSDHQEGIKTNTPQTITVSPPLNQDEQNYCHSHCSFIEEVICKVPGSLRIHPSLWSKDDVIQWLRWAEEEYSLEKTDDSKFVMNGRALCILTKLDFKARSPSSGDVLYELLQCIKNHRQGLVRHSFFRHCIRNIHDFQLQTCLETTSENSQLTSRTIHPAATESADEDVPLNLCQRTQGTQTKKSATEDNDIVDGKIKDCRFLWDYLHKLLDDKRYESSIIWEDKELKIFRVVNPNMLAAFWGNHKNRPNMTYEKMSRALRQYYKKKPFEKRSWKKAKFQVSEVT